MTVLSFPLSRNSVAQPTPSGPTSEVTIKAGEPFTVNAQMRAPATQQLLAIVTYQLNPRPGSAAVPLSPSPPPTTFQCRGYTQPNNPSNQILTLQCTTNRQLLGGDYSTDGQMNLVREETNESEKQPVRSPIVTMVADPFAATQFPVIVSTSLSLTHHQSLSDGAVRAQVILDSLNAHFPSNTVNNKETRAYLRQEVEKAKIQVVDLTGKRYAAAQPSGTPLPIFFEDFDRRLDKITRELGGVPTAQRITVPTAQRITAPRLVLAQLPKTTESVEAREQPGTLQTQVIEFVAVLTDVIKGFSKMIDSGTQSFSWSITTTPPGAEIWISRLGKPETKWAGLTNVKDQTLEYARWTFRIDWNGCSKIETPDPYLQSPIPMEDTKPGCK